MRSRVCIFLTRILIKTMSRKFYGICARTSCDSSEDHYFSRFYHDSKNMLLNTRMISDFTIFFTSSITNITILHFNMIPAVHLLITSFFLFLFTLSLKDSQNFFMQSLPLYISCLFSLCLMIL